MFAQIAQSVEQRTENPRVGGSIPPLGTMNYYGGIAQMARAFGSYPKGHRFDPCCRYHVLFFRNKLKTDEL